MALRVAYIDADFSPKHQQFPTVHPDDVLQAAVNRAVRTAIGEIRNIGTAADTHTFDIDDGTTNVTFEIDFNNTFTPGNVPLDFRAISGDNAGDFLSPATETYRKLQIAANAIKGSGLSIVPSVDMVNQTLILRNVDVGTAGNTTITVTGGTLAKTDMSQALNTLPSADLLHMVPLTNEGHKILIAWDV